jgi:hypothetical protein
MTMKGRRRGRDKGLRGFGAGTGVDSEMAFGTFEEFDPF